MFESRKCYEHGEYEDFDSAMDEIAKKYNLQVILCNLQTNQLKPQLYVNKRTDLCSLSFLVNPKPEKLIINENLIYYKGYFVDDAYGQKL